LVPDRPNVEVIVEVIVEMIVEVSGVGVSW